MRFALVLILAATSANSQQFKKLKIGFGFGAGIDWPQYTGYTSNATIVYRWLYIVPSSKAMIYDHTSNASAYGQLGNSYGSVKLGVLIGGGRK